MHLGKETIVTIIMSIGGFLLVVSFISQNYKIFKNKSALDISYLFVLLQIIVDIIYVSYAAIFLLYPILITNSIITLLLLVMFSQKIYYTYAYKKYCNASEDEEYMHILSSI